MHTIIRNVVLLLPLTLIPWLQPDAWNFLPFGPDEPGTTGRYTLNRCEEVRPVLNSPSFKNSGDVTITGVAIPGGEYEMGDHNGHYDPGHPDDEVPLHTVLIDSLLMSITETTNQQYLSFLNASLLSGSVQVTGNKVHLAGDTNTLYYTNQYASWYSIGFDGNAFYLADFRGDHPVVGVMWMGAAAFCNWLSQQNGLQECYDIGTWSCDFTKNGYRLPTEAEWEYAGRGGHTNPYLKYPNGNTVDVTQANLPNSGDPYETGPYPNTTPVGFYDGSLKLKSDYNWPGIAMTYQTSDGKNGYGLYDIQGNVWEFVNDWYAQNFYSSSPYDNPTGPVMGSLMPDGKPYRGMRGGNWYNGIDSNGVNDGHSRVSNRDPSYFRGPQDPNHPWYHVGFRVARNFSPVTGINENRENDPGEFSMMQNFPNPFSGSTRIMYYVPIKTRVLITVCSALDMQVSILANEIVAPGWHITAWDGSQVPAGIYFLAGSDGQSRKVLKMVVLDK